MGIFCHNKIYMCNFILLLYKDIYKIYIFSPIKTSASATKTLTNAVTMTKYNDNTISPHKPAKSGLSLSPSLARLVFSWSSLTHNQVKLVFSGAALVLVILFCFCNFSISMANWMLTITSMEFWECYRNATSCLGK